MGGQACVFYGAAEFSRDTDLAIVADEANLVRMRRALDALQAEVIKESEMTNVKESEMTNGVFYWSIVISDPNGA